MLIMLVSACSMSLDASPRKRRIFLLLRRYLHSEDVSYRVEDVDALQNLDHIN